MRTLLRGGQILDGAGAPAYRGDVRLNGDKIEAVGALSPLPDEQVIDVSGCVVCPAFCCHCMASFAHSKIQLPPR